jgi:putative FmdB family regulatory protein
LPLYRYKCEVCKEEWQEFCNMANRDDPLSCLVCDGNGKRLLDVASVSFIGKGFYSNDK